MANWIGNEYDPWHPRRERKPVDWFSLVVILVAFAIAGFVGVMAGNGWRF